MSTAAPYEMYAQREMNALAAKSGALIEALQAAEEALLSGRSDCALAMVQDALDKWNPRLGEEGT